MYQVRLSQDAARAFEQADAPLQRKLDRCFKRLGAEPTLHPSIRRLKGKLASYYRYRVGAWRVLYRIDEEKRIVWVATIEHRRDVYR